MQGCSMVVDSWQTGTIYPLTRDNNDVKDCATTSQVVDA